MGDSNLNSNENETTQSEACSDIPDSRGWISTFLGDATLCADMPTRKEDEEYNMKHEKRGKAVIFNNKNFNTRELPTRHGTDVDKENLKRTLTILGFEVEVYDDSNYYKTITIIDSLCKMDHSQYDCLLIAVLSHGETNSIYTSDGIKFDPKGFWDPFTAERCTTLAGKPKIFLFQACQGEEYDDGITLVNNCSSKEGRCEVDAGSLIKENYRIPNRADFIMAFSCVPGYFSWRNTSMGSWFIQAVCEVLKNESKKSDDQKRDFMTLLTIVSRKVGLDYESYSSNSVQNMKKQIPFVTSTLMRQIYFRKK